MKRYRLVLAITVGFLVPPSYALAQCQAGMVQNGSTCIDTFEASLWKITNPACVGLIKQGVKLPPWCLQGDAVQVGINGVDYTDAQCQFNGGGCKNIFALSMPGVIPARSINYFIAAAACRNSRKRLPSNAEWQAAALGTPDPWPQDDPATPVPPEWPVGPAHRYEKQMCLGRGRLRHGRQRDRVRRRLGRPGHDRSHLGRVHSWLRR